MEGVGKAVRLFAAASIFVLAVTASAFAQTRMTIAINTLGPETWWPQDIANNKYLTGTIGDPLVRLVLPYKLEPALADGGSRQDSQERGRIEGMSMNMGDKLGRMG